MGGVVIARRDDHSVNALAGDHLHIELLFGEIFVGIAEEHGVAGAVRRVFDPAGDSRPEGVRDVGEHQGQRMRALRTEAAGDDIWDVAEVGDRALDALARQRIHVTLAVEDPRDSDC